MRNSLLNSYLQTWCKIDDCKSGTPPKREHETHIFTWCKIDDCESETPPKQEDETCKLTHFYFNDMKTIMPAIGCPVIYCQVFGSS